MRTQTALAPLEKLSDPELLDRIRGGEARAMEALMRRHNRLLYRTARAILRDDHEAEEAVQDAYLHAYQGLAGFRGEAKVSTWLVRIAANEALMRRRRRARSAAVVPIEPTAEPDERQDESMANEAGPEGSAMRSETRRLVERRIDELPDAYRAVFVLRALEELSVEETAVVLGIPEATVRTRFFRARGLLREALAREIDHSLEQAFGFAGARCDRIVARVLSELSATLK